MWGSKQFPKNQLQRIHVAAFFSPLPTPVCLEKVSDDGGGDDGDGGDEEERDKLEDVEVGLLGKLDKFCHVFRRHLVTSYVIWYLNFCVVCELNRGSVIILNIKRIYDMFGITFVVVGSGRGAP